LNSGLCTCKASTLPLKQHTQSLASDFYIL
jgi:hypothetical protein